MKKVKRIVTFLMLVFAMVLASPVKNVVHAETTITINEIYFKDSNFRKWLNENADSNKDGKLSSSEISSVDKLSLSETGISTLEGKADGKWRYFVNGVQTRNNNTFVSQFGRLWHVNNGVLDTTDCFVRYNGKFVYSYHGMAATSYTGWVQYDQYKCYLVNGVLTKITR